MIRLVYTALHDQRKAAERIMRSPTLKSVVIPFFSKNTKATPANPSRMPKIFPFGNLISGNEIMCQKQCNKGLKIDQQGPTGSIAFAESKIKKRQLHGKQHGDNQQFLKLARS